VTVRFVPGVVDAGVIGVVQGSDPYVYLVSQL